MDEIRKQFEDGKYTLVRNSSGYMYALRHGEPWRDLTGDKLIGAMLHEIEDLQAALAARQPCTNCDGVGVVPYTTGQTAGSFEQGEYPCPDCAAQQPAQVDLGQFRELIDRWRATYGHAAKWGECNEHGARGWKQCAADLQALIDAQAK